MVHVLKQAGDDLTRENIVKQAASMKDVQLDMLLPGVKINTSAKDFFPIEQMQLIKFNGTNWELIGEVISGEVGS
jgi:branched-chain amino acid transport system substrate-binding protein